MIKTIAVPPEEVFYDGRLLTGGKEVCMLMLNKPWLFRNLYQYIVSIQRKFSHKKNNVTNYCLLL